MCTRCGKSVRKRDFDAHNYWTHGIGKKPELNRRSGSAVERPRRVVAPVREVGYTGGGKPLVACPRCSAKVLDKNLQKHLAKKCPRGKR